MDVHYYNKVFQLIIVRKVYGLIGKILISNKSHNKL
jgi:hypothetical protein